MNKDRYKTFIEKLINLSSQGKLRWEYLDGHIDIARHNNKLVTPMGTALFDTNNSFFLSMPEQNTFVILYKFKENPSEISLSVIPTTFKEVLHINSDIAGEQLTRLLNTVKHQFPNAQDFIDSILEL